MALLKRISDQTETFRVRLRDRWRERDDEGRAGAAASEEGVETPRGCVGGGRQQETNKNGVGI